MTPTITASVQTWIDKNELADLVAVLSSAVDRGDEERIASCYTAESYDDHGAFKGSGREFAAYICSPSPTREGDALLHHLLGQSIFEVDGDEAWGETFFIFHLSAGGQLSPGFGRYIDYFQRIDSRWKVKYRRVVPDWVGSVGSTVSPSLASYVRGARDRTDPLYDRRRWHD